MSSNLTVGDGGKGISDDNYRVPAHYQEQWENSGGGGVSEIVEEFADQVFDETNDRVINPLQSIKEEVENSSVFSFDFDGEKDGLVYVAIGKQSEESTSMDALIWALDNIVIPVSTVVLLIHVFPETKFVPTPLGKLPISQVNPEQRENHMAQQRGNRRELLQKFLNVCSNSQVKVDTILIESDMEAKAILDLIPILNIRKLVLGTTKSNARKMMSSRRGNGVADQILHNAPEFCEVKIICEGKEMSELAMESPSLSQSPRASEKSIKSAQDQKQINDDSDSAACGCFKL